MTDTHTAIGGPPRLTRLTFHGPLSETRAHSLVQRLTRTNPTTVLDIGCGWGELMLRILAAAPEATGTGIDVNAEDLARGRRNAEARGLTQRARFVEESAVGTSRGPADLVLCVGASQALSTAQPPQHTTEALRELRRLVTDGGRVLLGEGFWQRTPTPAELSGMWPGASATDHHDLATLLDLTVAAGFRPEWTETASLDEWEEFESAYQADVEVWLAEHPGHPLAAETRERLDRHRAQWMSYRGVLGLAYLTLVPAR
ncbi:class I SAM-dependent methyltransferase [Streptomyces sp. ISL-22]|uniref:SAM-dependent methyltransferase n=1 Tax=unclassified Streptomyces TaxID=2593676 RepID=UPI001BE90706|nr:MULTISPECIES: class I SAM-dependent methyltransferase [unclassified Streptomyces]MBT2418654.1 class I SAM-dependent methyltransferase [Streptomyces sp. ISL-24]MBT2432934.1 class I SAM-dependent methyltransferase [Streptomyces sp. ISL-22]